VKLRWTHGATAYYLITVCGRYTVCKRIVGETCLYGAWREAQPVWVRLGTYADSIRARRALQAYEDEVCAQAGRQRALDL
jgi:hypothetical protein